MTKLSLPFSYGTEIREYEGGDFAEAVYDAFTCDTIAATVVRGLVDVEQFYQNHPILRISGPDDREIPKGGAMYEDVDRGFKFFTRKNFSKALNNSIPELPDARETVLGLLDCTFATPQHPPTMLNLREVRYGIHREITPHIDDMTTFAAISIDLTPPDAEQPTKTTSEITALKLCPSLPERPHTEILGFFADWVKIPLLEREGGLDGITVAQTGLNPGDAAIFPFGTLHAVSTQVPERVSAVLTTNVMSLSEKLYRMSCVERINYHNR